MTQQWGLRKGIQVLNIEIMKFDKAVQHYGSQAELARAVGVTHQACQYWRDHGIPELRQYQLERLTRGKLKVGKR